MERATSWAVPVWDAYRTTNSGAAAAFPLPLALCALYAAERGRGWCGLAKLILASIAPTADCPLVSANSDGLCTSRAKMQHENFTWH